MSPFSALLLALVACILHVSGTEAQKCYYPDGTPTEADTPCPNSDLCCPLNWQCLSNGLCYYPPDGTYERRTCTDKTWKSEECPNFCTYSAAGNEAILQCPEKDNKYCCDGNRSGNGCCRDPLPAGTDYFALPEGKVAGTIQPPGQAAADAGPSTSLPAAQVAAPPSASSQPPASICACPPAT